MLSGKHLFAIISKCHFYCIALMRRRHATLAAGSRSRDFHAERTPGTYKWECARLRRKRGTRVRHAHLGEEYDVRLRNTAQIHSLGHAGTAFRVFGRGREKNPKMLNGNAHFWVPPRLRAKTRNAALACPSECPCQVSAAHAAHSRRFGTLDAHFRQRRSASIEPWGSSRGTRVLSTAARAIARTFGPCAQKRRISPPRRNDTAPYFFAKNRILPGESKFPLAVDFVSSADLKLKLGISTQDLCLMRAVPKSRSISMEGVGAEMRIWVATHPHPRCGYSDSWVPIHCY
jgi:hypothetical protein